MDEATETAETVEEVAAADGSDGSGGSDGSETTTEETTKSEETGTGEEKDGEKQPTNFERKVAKLTAKRREAEERAEAAEAEVAKLKAEMEGRDYEAAIAIGTRPENMSKADGAVLRKQAELRQDRRWLMEHSSSGYEGKDGSFTAEQVQARLGAVLDELDDVSARAAVIRDRIAQRELGRREQAKPARSVERPAAATRDEGAPSVLKPRVAPGKQAPTGFNAKRAMMGEREFEEEMNRLYAGGGGG